MVKELEDSPRDETAVLLDADAASSSATPRRLQLRARGPRRRLDPARRTPSRGRRAALLVNGPRPMYQRVHSFDGDWHRALEHPRRRRGRRALAAANCSPTRPGPPSRALELTVVTSALSPRLVERLAHRAMAHHGASLVYVDAASFAAGAPAGGTVSARGGRAHPAPAARRRPRRRPTPRRRPRRAPGRSEVSGGRWLAAASSSLSSRCVVTVSWLRLESIGVSWRDWLPMLLLRAPADRSRSRSRRSRLAIVRRCWPGATLFAAALAYETSRSRTHGPGIRSATSSAPSSTASARGSSTSTRPSFRSTASTSSCMHSLVLLADLRLHRARGDARHGAQADARPRSASSSPSAGPRRSSRGQRPLLAGRAGAHRRPGDPLSPAARRASRAACPTPPAWAPSSFVARRSSPRRTDAVAKPAFLSWQSWDPYDRPTTPVSVDYVWRANYEGIDFPEEPTVVMRVKASGPKRSLYWRATTLDDYTGDIWDEDQGLRRGRAARAGRRDRREHAPSAGGRQRGRTGSGRTSRSRRSATRTCWPRASPCAGVREPRRPSPTPTATSSSSRTRCAATSATPPGATSRRPSRASSPTFNGEYPAGGRALPRGRLRGRSRLERQRARHADERLHQRDPRGRLEDPGARVRLPGRPGRDERLTLALRGGRRSSRPGSARRAGSPTTSSPRCPSAAIRRSSTSSTTRSGATASTTPARWR